MNTQKLLYELNRLLPKQGTESSYLSGGRAGIELAITLIEELEEPEKVVIPQYVADWIEEEQGTMSNWKLPNRFISDSKYKKDHRRYKWSQVEGNMDKFMSALINGYEVEKEKLYYIVDKNDEVLWFRNRQGVPRLSGSTLRSVLKSESKQRYQFTEQEIRDYDERFWPFAVKVEELTD